MPTAEIVWLSILSFLVLGQYIRFNFKRWYREEEA